MENASKALIIAGAILISILIISFGVIILGQGSDVINNANMSEAEMAAFNGKFTAYEGDSIKGSNVRQLLRIALQSNLNQTDDNKKVEIVLKTTASDAGTKPLEKTSKNVDVSVISNASNYKVTCSYNDKTGLISKIDVLKNS